MLKNAAILLLASALAALLWLDLRRPVTQPGIESPAHPLEKLIDDHAGRPGFAGAALGFCLLDPDGRRVAGKNPHVALIPASSLKTLTTATSLEKWGPDHRIETRLTATAEILDGVIAGDLVVVGGGDPMLSLQDLRGWAGQLQKRGLKRVTGRILGDGRLFPGSIYDDFWNWGDIGNGYGSPVCGLNLEHNRYVVAFQAAEQVGGPAALLGMMPEVPGVTWVNETLTGAADSGDGVVIHGGERTGVLHFRGTVPVGQAVFQVTGAVPDPELSAAHHLKLALLEAGIEVAGAAEAVKDRAAGQVELLRHASPPLRDIITSIHATSDNHETECLFRLLGLRESKAAERVVREHWKGRGLEFHGLRMADGCGLARADFVTPHDLARLQLLAGTGPHGTVYKASLLQKGPLRWKGGAMSGVRSVTGIVTTSTGREMCFALMVNHYADAGAVAALREALVEEISRW
jgi:D-alanyl-D-alanine carboxypeptidase/D-alanyl-D-alanine-endopeptidase (penicillin-binding protein 4)